MRSADLFTNERYVGSPILINTVIMAHTHTIFLSHNHITRPVPTRTQIASKRTVNPHPHLAPVPQPHAHSRPPSPTPISNVPPWCHLVLQNEKFETAGEALVHQTQQGTCSLYHKLSPSQCDCLLIT